MRSWILAAAMALAATPALADSLPAPAPDGVVAQLGAAQNGQAVSVSQGDSFAVELQSNPSTGGRWAVAARPGFVAAAAEREGPTEDASDDEVGVPIWQVFVFTAAGVGNAPLRLELHGPGGQLWDTFSVTVNAH